MMLIENKASVIEQVEQNRGYLNTFHFMEMELVVKNISPECMKQLALHYNPTIPSDETINEPSEVAPYIRFSVKINNQLCVEFRGPKLEKTVTYKQIL